jgi:hypothetical protein
MLKDRDIAILQSFLIFPYMTPQQVCSYVANGKSFTQIQDRLLFLSGEKRDEAGNKRDHQVRYLHRTREEKSLKPYLYSLALRGTRELKQKPVFYGQPPPNTVQYRHFMFTNEILICASKLPQLFPHLTPWSVQHDWELKHILKIVKPDGLVIVGNIDERIGFCFEAHIKESEEKFREKIRGIYRSIETEFRERYPLLVGEDGLLNLTWSFLTPSEEQLKKIIYWTEDETLKLGKTHDANLFRFAQVAEERIDPMRLFCEPIHRIPFSQRATSLI